MLPTLLAEVPSFVLSCIGKGKGCKEREAGIRVDEPVSVQPEPMTVEFSVQLEKWQSASEARQLLPQQDS